MSVKETVRRLERLLRPASLTARWLAVLRDVDRITDGLDPEHGPVSEETVVDATTDRRVAAPPASGLTEREPARLQFQRLYRLMALTDAAGVVLALVFGRWVRYGWHATADLFFVTLMAPVATVGLFRSFRLYETHRFTAAEEFRRVFLALTIGMMALVTFGFWAHSTLSRSWILVTWLLALAATIGGRRLWHAQIGRASCRERV